jgi:hypothetical protein
VARYEYLELPRYSGKQRLVDGGDKITFVQALSQHANEGWRVHSVFSSTNGGGGSFLFESEIVTSIFYLLEREVTN